MTTTELLLQQRASQVEDEGIITADISGIDKPVEISIRRLTAMKLAEMKKRSSTTNKHGTETDGIKLAMLIIEYACTDPNFRDLSVAKAIAGDDCDDAFYAIDKAFGIAGIIDVSNKILEFSGLDINDDEGEAEAYEATKNS